MPGTAWSNSPDELGPFDAAVLRCIAGELTQEALARATRGALIDGQRRMASLLRRHRAPDYAGLSRLPALARQELAEEILAAELNNLETAPGALVPLMPIFTTPPDHPFWRSRSRPR